jgi:hypothetical protein
VKEKKNSDLSITTTFVSQMKKNKEKSKQKKQSHMNSTVNKISHIPYEDTVRIQQAEKIIFSEDEYLKYLKRREQKDLAATSIQCLVRKFFARREFRRLLKERAYRKRIEEVERQRRIKLQEEAKQNHS